MNHHIYVPLYFAESKPSDYRRDISLRQAGFSLKQLTTPRRR